MGSTGSKPSEKPSETTPLTQVEDEHSRKQNEKHAVLIKSSLARIMAFQGIAMPVVFISLMYVGGFVMTNFAHDWTFERGFNFMASAVTGGAIVFPASPPATFRCKLFASCAASLGVGIFGFMVALQSNSLAAPLVKAMGIGIQDNQQTDSRVHIAKISKRLAQLALVVMGTNLLGAIVFGMLMAYTKGWDFWTAFKTMGSVELGGGIAFNNMGEVNNGKLLYTTVGVWSISTSTLMIAVAGDPGHTVVMRALGIRLEDGTTARQAIKMLSYLVFLVLPVSLLLIMLSVAAIMTPLTRWTAIGAFWAALPAVSGGAAALSSHEDPPLTMEGAAILICTASAGFFMLSIMMGVGGEMVDPIVKGPWIGRYLGKKRGVWHSVAALIFISAILIPVCVFLGSTFVGAAMSLANGWHFSDGFWWCVSVQLGGGMALTEKQVTSPLGMCFGVVAVAWSIGISILSIGVSGAPVVVPLMDAMAMTIDPADLEEIAAAAKAVRGIDHRFESLVEEAEETVKSELVSA